MATEKDTTKDAQAFTRRLQGLIDQKFKGNVSAFVRRCQDVGGKAAPSNGALVKYLKGSEPGRDKLVIMARAAGVSVGWLAAGEPLTEEIQDRRYVGTDEIQPDPEKMRLVKPGNMPEPPANEYPFVVIQGMGKQVLEVGFRVKGMREPIILPVDIPGH